ncbi:hypothetical protein [Sphaerospermopsis sp. LEGE 08334]|uniref:hypothetical protein n=1 Tax=Sphaerospermopsis sp. LEGE 08334 TaxID=1828651 RepID=UPI00187DF32F|nr:hypothetical protein [Sphaerospermopsis sp. LEGE 08334]MBE9056556.1 hypothetical protein [Sphaerospermopsis sp. LEGE 08334]
MKKSIKKTSPFFQVLITGFTFISSITVANASPYVATSDSYMNDKRSWYVDLETVTQVSDRIYKYVKAGVNGTAITEFNINVINDQFVKKMKSLESEVIVNCNDTTSLQILQNRYYKNGKLVKTEKLNKILKHSQSNRLENGNVIVCRFFDSASFQAIKAGFYAVGLSNGIRIAIRGNRICYEEFNRRNFTVASVVRHPRYLSLYQLESVEKRGFYTKEPYYLFQVRSNEIIHGTLAFHGVKETSIPWETSKKIEQCLNSNKVFWYFEKLPGSK